MNNREQKERQSIRSIISIRNQDVLSSESRTLLPPWIRGKKIRIKRVGNKRQTKTGITGSAKHTILSDPPSSGLSSFKNCGLFSLCLEDDASIYPQPSATCHVSYHHPFRFPAFESRQAGPYDTCKCKMQNVKHEEWKCWMLGGTCGRTSWRARVYSVNVELFYCLAPRR